MEIFQTYSIVQERGQIGEEKLSASINFVTNLKGA